MISLAQIALFLSAAIVTVPLFRWLRLSSIVGYLAAGLAIGPWGLRLVTDVGHILHAAEFGIVLLMFIIGLELQPTRLLALRRTVFGLGGAEVGLCTLLLAFYDARLQAWLSPAVERPFDPIEERENRIIIAGFGQIVARVLRARRIRFTALDANQTQVDFVRRYGNKVFYGDAARLDLLHAAGADKAEVFVLAVDDVEASVRVAELLRNHFPHLKVFARARNRQHAFRLMDCGVRYLIRETYGSSLELTTAVLETLGETRTDAVNAVRLFRRHDEKTLLAQYEIKDDETKLIASTWESAQQLEHLFETDQQEEPGPRESADPVAISR